MVVVSGTARRLPRNHPVHRDGYYCLSVVPHFDNRWQTYTVAARRGYGERGVLGHGSRLDRTAMGVGRYQYADGYMDKRAMRDQLLLTGVIGTIFAAICCFTPALVILLSIVGLSSIVGYLDFVLLPTLAIFLIITGYALWRRMTSR